MNTHTTSPALRAARKALPVLIGAAAGYAWWYFVGCSTGHCPITANWYTSTIYGAVAGASYLLPTGRKKAATEAATPGASDETAS